MKELSIEEKAKAYEGLIERLKDLKFAYRFSPLSDTIDEIFPELKVDEDEMIRKELTEFLKSASGGFLDITIQCETFGKWLTWLKKQVPVDEDKIVKGIRRGVAISLMNHIDANSKGMCLSNMECEDIENAIVNEDWDKVYGYMKKKLEKPGEQETLCDKCKKAQPSHSCQDITALGRCAVEHEQKSAWSEEDIRNIDDIDSVLFYDKDLPEDTCVRLRNWLKSLKERVLPQPKHAWSEEDEAFYNKTIGLLKQYASDNEVRKQSAMSCINWLKSAIKHEKIAKYKIGDRVRFFSHAPIFTITGIDEANERYISQSGDFISFYEELIPAKGNLNKDDIKCGDYLTTEDGTVIKVHDIDENECVHHFYYASNMTEDGGDISNNFMYYCAILSDCRRSTQEEINFLEKWVAHKKYVWVKNNVSPYDEEED